MPYGISCISGNLPHLHCGIAVYLSLVLRINYPSQHSNSLLACWFTDLRSPLWQDRYFNFSFSGIIVVFIGGIIHFTGTKTFRSAKNKITGTRLKKSNLTTIINTSHTYPSSSILSYKFVICLFPQSTES